MSIQTITNNDQINSGYNNFASSQNYANPNQGSFNDIKNQSQPNDFQNRMGAQINGIIRNPNQKPLSRKRNQANIEQAYYTPTNKPAQGPISKQQLVDISQQRLSNPDTIIYPVIVPPPPPPPSALPILNPQQQKKQELTNYLSKASSIHEAFPQISSDKHTQNRVLKTLMQGQEPYDEEENEFEGLHDDFNEKIEEKKTNLKKKVNIKVKQSRKKAESSSSENSNSSSGSESSSSSSKNENSSNQEEDNQKKVLSQKKLALQQKQAAQLQQQKKQIQNKKVDKQKNRQNKKKESSSESQDDDNSVRSRSNDNSEAEVVEVHYDNFNPVEEEEEEVKVQKSSDEVKPTGQENHEQVEQEIQVVASEKKNFQQNKKNQKFQHEISEKVHEKLKGMTFLDIVRNKNLGIIKGFPIPLSEQKNPLYRHARQLIIRNIPTTCATQYIVEYLFRALQEAGGSMAPGNPIETFQRDQKGAIHIELRSIEETSLLYQLDGINVWNKYLKINRPAKYLQNPSVIGERPLPVLDLSKLEIHGIQIIKSSEQDTPTRLFMNGIPKSFDEKQVIDKYQLKTFGKILAFRFPREGSEHKGYAFIEYTTVEEAEKAIAELNETDLFGKKFILRFANRKTNNQNDGTEILQEAEK